LKENGPVLVTGASSGIGRAIAETLADSGHLVYAAARKKADLDKLARIKNVEPVRLDVTKPEEVANVADHVKRKGKGLFGLVNCAGLGDVWPLIGSTDEDLVRLFEVNVFGVHTVTRSMLPFLIESRGRIVNIGSLGGIASTKPLGAYCMTKFAVEAYSEVLASELARYGVRVAVLEPGDYRTNIVGPIARYVREREGERSVALVRDEEVEAKKWLAETRGSFDQRQDPRAVAKAALYALHSPHPRFRYAVAPTAGQLAWALEGLTTRLVQADLGGGRYAITRKEIHAMVDKAWEREAKKLGHP
jgi:NAD(P)-dependent dehydrogenase (short-subunit alcohol dehydrogenase family)